jgi:hypothetical protein
MATGARLRGQGHPPGCSPTLSGGVHQRQAVYRLFGSELGIEPGRSMRRLHDQILRGDAALDPTPEPVRLAGPPGPRQLPLDVRDFTGLAAAQPGRAARGGDRPRCRRPCRSRQRRFAHPPTTRTTKIHRIRKVTHDQLSGRLVRPTPSGHSSPAAGEDADDGWLEVEGLDACQGEAGLAEPVGDISSGSGRGLLGGAWAAWLCGDGDTSAWLEQGA